MEVKFLYPDVIQKARENNIAEFTEKEFDRVFGMTVSKSACKRGMYRMISNGLKIEDVIEQQQRLF